MDGLGRRLLVKSAVLAGFGLAAMPVRAEPDRATKVVYHLVDAERVAMALGNLRNHVVGAGGPGAARFACVVLGPALKPFRRSGGDLGAAATLLGRPYSISGHVIYGRQLGRQLGASSIGAQDGFRTLNVRFGHPRPAVTGIFAVRTHGLSEQPLDGVASLGVRPTVEDGGRVLLEVHSLDWPAALGLEGGYGKIVRVELLHKLRDEMRYTDLNALTAAIARDVDNARAYFAAHASQGRQTRRDRIS